MSIFGDQVRHESGPARHGETTYGFLCRVAGDYWDQCRELLDSWLGLYPELHRSSLAGQLTSGDDRQFISAFWELYLYETYRHDGWEITIHPDVPLASTHPDFLVEKDGRAHYVEARCVFAANRSRPAQARLETVYAAVNGIDSGSFHLAVTALQIGESSPPTRRLRADLESWIQGLDPDNVDTALGPENAHALEWKHDDWRIRFIPMPRSPGVREQPAERPIGLYMPAEAEFIDDIHPLRDALEEKGRRYGELPHPLVLAIHVARPFHDDSDTTQALFGTVGYQFDRNSPENDALPVIVERGYWHDSSGPRNVHVAGVVLADSLHYAAVAKAVPTFWSNPWSGKAVVPLPIWSSVDYERSTLSTAARIDPRTSAFEHFDLPSDWPKGVPFPRD